MIEITAGQTSAHEISARERGRENKAWGGAQRNPRERTHKVIQACEAGDRNVPTICRPLRGLEKQCNKFLGFRCAPPQALLCRLLRRLKTTVKLSTGALLIFVLFGSA